MKKLTPTNIFLFLSVLLATLQNSGLMPTATTPTPLASDVCPKAPALDLDAGTK